MLSRLKGKPAVNAEHDALVAALESKLALPKRPKAIEEADAVVKEATGQRMAAEARHREALRQLEREKNRNLEGNKPAVVPTISHAEVDEIGAQLAGYVETERAASEAAKEARSAYQADIETALVGPLQELKDAIAAKLDEVEELAALGVKLHSQAVSARIELPSSVAGLCSPVIDFAVRHARGFLAKAVQRRARI